MLLCLYSNANRILVALNPSTSLQRIGVYNPWGRPVYTLSAMIPLLGSIQIHPLSAVVHTDGPRLGAYSFRTATSAFWIRGNLFIQAQYFSSKPESKLELEVDISALAADIDAQLASGKAAPHLWQGGPSPADRHQA
ncbi:hypothetical protein MAJ_05498, partial [Metarhizium majus ARSEF 297]